MKRLKSIIITLTLLAMLMLCGCTGIRQETRNRRIAAIDSHEYVFSGKPGF